MGISEGEIDHPARSLLVSAAHKRTILIVCHNNPDPDTMAAAMGLKSIFYNALRCRAVIGYGGIVGRAENRQLIRRLKIELTNIRDIDFDHFSLICLVDSQPGTGNNDIPREILPDVVIDHHLLRGDTKKCSFYDVRPRYGSASTIITEYLRELKIPVDRKLATALFYGIKTDTNGLSRSATKADLDAFNYLFPLVSPRTLAAIENPSMPKSYYLKFIESIENSIQYQDVIVSHMGKLNNPDIVAEMADFLLRMENIRWVLCLGEHKEELIISVRTSRRGWWAGKIALKILRGIGSGGGHEKAAGGKVVLNGLSLDQRKQKTERVVERFLKAVGISEHIGKPLITRHVQEHQ